MNAATQDINAGLPAAAPRQWFIVHGGDVEHQFSLDALLVDNADDAELYAWAKLADVGDKFYAGMAGAVERIA